MPRLRLRYEWRRSLVVSYDSTQARFASRRDFFVLFVCLCSRITARYLGVVLAVEDNRRCYPGNIQSIDITVVDLFLFCVFFVRTPTHPTYKYRK